MTATLRTPVKDEQLGTACSASAMFVWFDVAAQGGGEPSASEWRTWRTGSPRLADHGGPGFPGPGHGLRDAAKATLTGYWLDSTPADSDRLVLPTADTKPKEDQLVRRVGEEDRDPAIECPGRTLRIDLTHDKGDKVVVGSH